MQLSRALQVGKGDVLSLVGAGGKTTTMYRLAAELASDGWKVVTTTTTMIWREDRCGFTVLEAGADRLIHRVSSALTERRSITVASGFNEAKGKLIGIDPSVVDALLALPQVDVVIVEADGAKGRSLKGPAPYEPVIPASTSILMPLAAIDALGNPLDDRFVHRPEIVARLAQTQPGEIITPEIMSTVLLHPEGGLKNAPPLARVVPLINKVSASNAVSGREVALSLLHEPRVERVLLTAVAEDDPVKEVWGRVAAIVLAAGGSSRFGSPKQLIRWKGKTLLEHVVDTALAASVQETVVVLGHQAEAARAVLADRPVRVMVNEDWESGQSSSVRAGVQALPRRHQACLFLLVDQPNVTSALIDDVLGRYRRTLAPLVVPIHGSQRGNPVLFDQSLFPELLQARGDEGGRQVIARHEGEVKTVQVGDQSLFLDIDTVEDYEAAR
jgi:molybdenum cofactor cytidylyltransferase